MNNVEIDFINKKAKDKVIKTVRLDSDELVFIFEDGDELTIKDDGQSCCETRYMDCQDDLFYYDGAKFLELEVRNVEESQEDYETYIEIAFLLINTSKGSFTISNYNEHNGYYGGFNIIGDYETKKTNS